MSTTRSWAVLLLLALLLAPAAMPGASAATLAITLDASRDVDHALIVKVGSNVATSGTLVVTHEDPLVGTVVDRVLRVALEEGERATYRLPDMRAGVALRIRFVDGQGPGRLPYADLYDGATAATMPTLASLTVPAANENGRLLNVPVWEADRHPSESSGSEVRSLVTSQGVVVVAYQHTTTGQLAARVSRNGGHTWGYEHVLGDTPQTSWVWSFGETSSGVVRFFVHTANANDIAQPWTVFDLHTLSDSLSTALGVTNTVPQLSTGLVVRSDGTALLVTSNATGVHVHRLRSGASSALVSTIQPLGDASNPAIAARGDHVVVVYGASLPVARMYAARSTDGGASFSSPAELASLTGAMGSVLYVPTPLEPAMQADGTLHVLARGGAEASDRFYVRATIGGADSTLSIGDNGESHLAVSGSRVVLTDWVAGRQRWQESVDSGLTFTRGPDLEIWWGHTGALAILADGRSVLYGEKTVLATNGPMGAIAVALPFDPEPTTGSERTASEIARPRLRDLTIPGAGQGGSASVTLYNEGGLATQATLRVSVNDTQVSLTSHALAGYGADTLSFPLPVLSPGDRVEVRVVENDWTITTWTLAPPPSPPTASPSPTPSSNWTWTPPTPIEPTSPSPSPYEPTPWSPPTPSPAPVERPSSPSPSPWSPTPTTPAVPPRASTPPTPTPTGTRPTPSPTPAIPSPAPTPTPTPAPSRPPVTMVVTPSRIELAAGGSVDLSIIMTNVGDEDFGAEAPLLAGLPEGVTATVLETGWSFLPEGASKTYLVRLTADPAAQLDRQRANVTARYATDASPLTFALDVRVTEASAPAPKGFSAAFARTPTAVKVGAGAFSLLGVFGVAARTDWGRVLGGLALVPLYSRLKRADVLKHEVRSGIYEHIRANPGARFEEVREALELPAGGLQFHLRVLEREGYVRVVKEWTRRRYYAQGAPLPVSVSPTEQTLAEMLSREPGLTAGQVAQQLGISRQLARYHLKRLEKQGWLKAEGEGAAVGYKLTR